MKSVQQKNFSLKKPDWIRVPIPTGDNVASIRALKNIKKLHTVCESALCPNIGVCWGVGQATFMILGNGCTRNCLFCAISEKPQPVDRHEPLRVAETIKTMGLKHAVITSVTRDDLADGGASFFSDTIAQIRKICPDTTVEVLIPDFGGNTSALNRVMTARPDILGHNIETVSRLFPTVRPEGDFQRSIDLLRSAKTVNQSMITKSGLMVGIGETSHEILETFNALRSAGVSILTIGQYLRPGFGQLPVSRYYHPDEFVRLRKEALDMGFSWVESGPLVRSSFQAQKQAEFFKLRSTEG